MARIDVVKAKIDLFKTVFSIVVLGMLVSLGVYNIQTSGEHIIVVLYGSVILLILGLIFFKRFKRLFDELENL